MTEKLYLAKDDDQSVWLFVGKPTKEDGSWIAFNSTNALGRLPESYLSFFQDPSKDLIEVEIKTKEAEVEETPISLEDRVEVVLTEEGAKHLNEKLLEIINSSPSSSPSSSPYFDIHLKTWEKGDLYRGRFEDILRIFSSRPLKSMFSSLRRISLL